MPAGDGGEARVLGEGQDSSGVGRLGLFMGLCRGQWASRSPERQSLGRQQTHEAQLRAEPQSCPQRPQTASGHPKTKDAPSPTATSQHLCARRLA